MKMAQNDDKFNPSRRSILQAVPGGLLTALAGGMLPAMAEEPAARPVPQTAQDVLTTLYADLMACAPDGAVPSNGFFFFRADGRHEVMLVAHNPARPDDPYWFKTSKPFWHNWKTGERA